MNKQDTNYIAGIFILAVIFCVAVIWYAHQDEQQTTDWGVPVVKNELVNNAYNSGELTIDLPTEPVTSGKLIKLPVRNLEDKAVDSARVFCFPDATCFPSRWQGQTSIVFQATAEQCYTLLIVADGNDGYEYDIIELFVGGKEDDDTTPTPDKAESLLIGIVYDPEERDNQREWLEVLTSKDIRSIDRTTVEFISVNTRDPNLQKWAVQCIDNKPTLIIANEQGQILSAEILPTNKSEAVATIKEFLE